ncbi:U2-associated splicing factor, partial [Globisporangium splendens]
MERPANASAAKKKASEGGNSNSSGAAAATLPWGMEKTQMQPGSLTALTDDKLARFVIGQQKKTKFEKDREDRVAKKRQADEEAAKIYAQFVASFEDEEATLGKAFVRGETAVKGDNPPPSQHVRGEVYRLKPKVDTSPAAAVSVGVSSSSPGSSHSGKKRSEMDRMLEEMKQMDADRQQRRELYHASHSGSSGPTLKKRREIDQFLEELKEREPVAPLRDTAGSFDNGDPETTNLYVGNLAPTTTEEALEAQFGRFGEIYSVKIMWPRTEEERARKRNCGFVSFYHRSDADDARIHLNDKELDGQPIVVGWGKAVKIDFSARKASKVAVAAPVVIPPPAVDLTAASASGKLMKIEIELPSDADVRARVDRLARYVAKDGLEFENAIRAREVHNKQEYGFLFESQSALAKYYRWRVTDVHDRDRIRVGTVDVMTREDHEDREATVGVGVEIPVEEDRLRRRQETVGVRVLDIVNRALCAAVVTIRDMVEVAVGAGAATVDDTGRDRVTPHHEDGSVITMTKAVRVTAADAHVLDLARVLVDVVTAVEIAVTARTIDAVSELLRDLTLERESVKKVMGFALDHSEAAVDIVHVMLESFQKTQVSAVTLVGYLYVTSDILHNSSAAVKNASLFRTTFQECLPEIVDHLRLTHKAIVGRMSANAMKERVLNVLTTWESWSLFPPMFLVGLNATFLRKVEESEYQSSQPVEIPDGEVDEERLRKACRQAGILSNGDAKQLLARLQWLKEFTAPKMSQQPSSQVTKKQAELGSSESTVAKSAPSDTKQGNDDADIDGEPIDGDEDLDGQPLDDNGDEDVDGEPLEDEGDLDGEPLEEEDLDGEPLDEEQAEGDLDGVPMDEEDLDGEPM